jgi:hypothetical protein
MNTIEHLKVITAEELSELISAATKLQTYIFKNLRFGDHAMSPINEIPSFQEVVQEAADVVAMLEMVSEEYCDNQIFDRTRIEAKKAKVRLMMERARNHSALQKDLLKIHKIHNLVPIIYTIEEFEANQYELSNGVGYWATEVYTSNSRTSSTPKPDWATHVAWYAIISDV